MVIVIPRRTGGSDPYLTKTSCKSIRPSAGQDCGTRLSRNAHDGRVFNMPTITRLKICDSETHRVSPAEPLVGIWSNSKSAPRTQTDFPLLPTELFRMRNSKLQKWQLQSQVLRWHCLCVFETLKFTCNFNSHITYSYLFYGKLTCGNEEKTDNDGKQVQIRDPVQHDFNAPPGCHGNEEGSRVCVLEIVKLILKVSFP